MDIYARIEEAMARLTSTVPRSQTNFIALKPHFERFVEEINRNPELSGVVIQLAMAKPYLANNYVCSINIASSEIDTQAAVAALGRIPCHTEPNY